MTRRVRNRWTLPLKKKKKKIKRSELKINSFTVGGIDNKLLTAAFEKENSQSLQDRIIAETNDARNKLEGYVLEMRNKLGADLKDFVRASVKEKFLADLAATEDWLYNDGLDVSKSEYQKRMTDLRTTGDAAEARRYEQEHRLEFASALKKTLLHYQQWSSSSDEKWSHITADERKKCSDECAAAEHWLATELSKQEKIPIADQPVVTTGQIAERKTRVENFCQPILSRAKPEPPKPKVDEKKPDDKKPEAAKPADDKKPATDDKKAEEPKK
jgi:heat shock protein 4